MTQGIYLDNSTTTRPSERCISKMLPFYTEMWGSPSAPHQMGQELFPAIAESLKSIYSLLDADENDSFVFTSSGAEAVNQAIFSGYFDLTRNTGKNQFITSSIDEAPALMSISRLEQMGCVGKLVQPNDKGIITAEAISEAITPRTAMISLSWANGLTGVVNPVNEISALCKERGIRFHLDASHVLGKLFYKMDEVNADIITFNGDQIHAPPGTGGLYIKKGTLCGPFIVGGLEQGGRRAGSYSIAGLAALGYAAQEALECRDLLCTEVARLRNKLEQGIVALIPAATCFFQEQDRLPNCSAIAFPGIVNEALLFALNRQHLFASIGGGSFQQIGLILSACSIPTPQAQSAICFSLSRTTTEDEIDRAIEIISDTVLRLQKTSVHIL